MVFASGAFSFFDKSFAIDVDAVPAVSYTHLRAHET